MHRRCWALVMLGALTVSVAPMRGYAQTVPATGWAAAVKSTTKQAASTPTVTPGPQAYQDGVQAFVTGQYAVAVEKLTLALSAGNLKAGQSAHALYYRGVSYRALKRPDLAIPDLTNALLKKSALSESERADALQHRSAAFSDGGLSDQADAPDVRQTSRVRAVQGAPPQIAAAAAPAPAVAQPTAQAAAQPQADPAAPASSNGIFGFMSALMSPSAPAAKPPGADAGAWVTTGSTTSVPRPQPPAPVAKAVPALPAPAPIQTVAAPAAQKAAPPQPVTGQVWRLQLPSQRDKKTAEATLAKVKAKNAALAKRQASIEQVNVGGMGEFWLTRIGPIAQAQEANDLCTAIRSGGVDCFVSGE